MTRLLHTSAASLSAFTDELATPLRALLAGAGDDPPAQRLTQWAGFTTPALIERLLVDAGGEAAPVLLTLFPAAHVAWADGEADEVERRCILQAAWELELDTDRRGWQRLAEWLREPPPLHAAILFNEFVDAAARTWSAQRYAHWQLCVLELTRTVAVASGGGWLASPISAPQAAWLESLAQTLDPLR